MYSEKLLYTPKLSQQSVPLTSIQDIKYTILLLGITGRVAMKTNTREKEIPSTP